MLTQNVVHIFVVVVVEEFNSITIEFLNLVFIIMHNTDLG